MRFIPPFVSVISIPNFYKGGVALRVANPQIQVYLYHIHTHKHINHSDKGKLSKECYEHPTQQAD